MDPPEVMSFKSSGIRRKAGSVGSIPMHLRHKSLRVFSRLLVLTGFQLDFRYCSLFDHFFNLLECHRWGRLDDLQVGHVRVHHRHGTPAFMPRQFADLLNGEPDLWSVRAKLCRRLWWVM